MFKKLLNNFLEPTKNEPPTLNEEGMLSLMAIFIRIAKLDGHFDEDERSKIKTFLKRRYNVSNANLDGIIASASSLESELNDNVQLTKKIKDNIPFQDRYDLLKEAWQLIMADGKRSYEEDSFMRLFSKLIGVSDKDNAIARKDILKLNE